MMKCASPGLAGHTRSGCYCVPLCKLWSYPLPVNMCSLFGQVVSGSAWYKTCVDVIVCGNCLLCDLYSGYILIDLLLCFACPVHCSHLPDYPEYPHDRISLSLLCCCNWPCLLSPLPPLSPGGIIPLCVVWLVVVSENKWSERTVIFQGVLCIANLSSKPIWDRCRLLNSDHLPFYSYNQDIFHWFCNFHA